MCIVPTFWPTWTAVADDLGIPRPTVYSWAQRGIPARHYLALITAARKRGLSLTFEMLAGISAPSGDDAGVMPDAGGASADAGGAAAEDAA